MQIDEDSIGIQWFILFYCNRIFLTCVVCKWVDVKVQYSVSLTRSVHKSSQKHSYRDKRKLIFFSSHQMILAMLSVLDQQQCSGTRLEMETCLLVSVFSVLSLNKHSHSQVGEKIFKVMRFLLTTSGMSWLFHSVSPLKFQSYVILPSVATCDSCIYLLYENF